MSNHYYRYNNIYSNDRENWKYHNKNKRINRQREMTEREPVVKMEESQQQQQQPPQNYREIEIISMNQTEPTRIKDKKDSKDETKSQTDFEKEKDENSTTANHNQHSFFQTNSTNFQQDSVLKDELNLVLEPLHQIISKIEEIDIEKQMNKINEKVKEKCSSVREQAFKTLYEFKANIEKKVEECSKGNSKDLTEIKALLSWQCRKDLRAILSTLRGDKYSKPVTITSVYDFEKYFNSILSEELKSKLVPKKNFQEIIHLIYNNFGGKKEDSDSISADEEFWFLINNCFSSREERTKKDKIKLTMSGSVSRVIKKFSSDDVIIEFGEVIPILTREKVAKAKKKIKTIINIIYEILFRLMPMSELSAKKNAYGHLYYGNKEKVIECKDFLENDIYFDFVCLR